MGFAKLHALLATTPHLPSGHPLHLRGEELKGGGSLVFGF